MTCLIIKEKRYIHVPQTFTVAKVPAKEVKISVEEILGELANLKLDEKSALALNWKPSANKEDGDKAAPRLKNGEKPLLGPPSDPPKSDTQKSSDGRKKKSGKKDTTVIVISSSDESEPFSHRLDRTSKQAAIRLLILEAQRAVNTRQLGLILHRLLKTLQANRSKVITKDALEFLTVFSKRLGDPSAVTAGGPPKSEKSDVTESSDKSDRRLRSRPPPASMAKNPAVIEALRMKLLFKSGKYEKAATYAPLIEDFIAAVRHSSNKSLTKDGAALLYEMANQIMETKE